MGKHVADRPRTPELGGRLKRFTEIERGDGGPHVQTRELQQRPRGARNDARRAAEYLRIERGRTA
jgi:hypothetical protein